MILFTIDSEKTVQQNIRGLLATINCSGCANCRSSATQMQSCKQVTRRCSRPEVSIPSQHLSLLNQLYVNHLSSYKLELKPWKPAMMCLSKMGNLSLHFKIDPPTHPKSINSFCEFKASYYKFSLGSLANLDPSQ